MIVPLAIFVVLMLFIMIAIILTITAPCSPVPVNGVIQPSNATFQQAARGYVCAE